MVATFGAEAPLHTVELGEVRAQPRQPLSARVDDVSFRLAVDPRQRTFLTVECFASDVSPYKTIVFVDDQQATYRDGGDYEPLISSNPQAVSGKIVSYTVLLPPLSTVGKREVVITLRTFRSEYRPSASAAGSEIADEASRRFIRAHSHLSPLRDIPRRRGNHDQRGRAVVRPPASEERAQVAELQEWQTRRLDDLIGGHAPRSGRTLSIERYRNELRFVAEALRAGWFGTRAQSSAGDALERVIESIDDHVRGYFADVRSVATGGHQSDWGGYYAALGEVLYILEPVLGGPRAAWFEDLLSEPFDSRSEGDSFSLPPLALDGAPLTRRSAWERALKANFDFARSRLSYIYNQVMFTYEGAWKAHEGLRVISSKFYEGIRRSHQILSEALGLAPFRGEEVLLGRADRELDLQHSLFHHDKNVILTQDAIEVVLKGLAESATDAKGAPLRREPYGKVYRGLTVNGLPRENGYVGVYGELVNVLPLWFFRTADHEADQRLNDEILRRTLDNAHARSFFRYPGGDDGDARRMLLEQVIDERNPALPGRVAYVADAESGAALRYAAVYHHMIEHPEKYGTDDWRPFVDRAREGASYARQMLEDGRFLPEVVERRERLLIDDLRLTDTYARLQSTDAPAGGRLLPHARERDFEDGELRALGVSRAEARTREERPFAFVDIDSLVLSLRDGDTHLFASLTSRNRGFSGVGRAHVMVGDEHQVAAVSTTGVIRSRSWALRGPTREELRQHGPDRIVEGRQFAALGEVLPIAFQPGVGEIRRDNFNEDNPYSALPELAITRLGDYLAVVNTTRDEHGNSRTYEVPVPGTPDDVFDLVSGRSLPVSEEGFVVIEPSQAMVLRVGAAEESTEQPRSAGVELRKGPALQGIGSCWYGLHSDTLLDRLEQAPREGWMRYMQGEGTTAAYAEAPHAFEIGLAEPGRFGSGDDARLHERGYPDAFSAMVTEAVGDIDVTARVEDNSGFAGLMVREDMTGVSRYVAFGYEGEELTVRTRSLDSREDFGVGNPGQDAAGGRTRSPTRIALGVVQNGRIRLRLSRDFSCHRFRASTSFDGGAWVEVWTGVVPMLGLVRAGAVLTGAGRVADLRSSPSGRSSSADKERM